MLSAEQADELLNTIQQQKDEEEGKMGRGRRMKRKFIGSKVSSLIGKTTENDGQLK